MNVNPTEALPHQLALVDKVQNLVVVGYVGLRESGQQAEDLRAVLHATARQLADDERVAQDLTSIEELGEIGVAVVKMIDPD